MDTAAAACPQSNPSPAVRVLGGRWCRLRRTPRSLGVAGLAAMVRRVYMCAIVVWGAISSRAEGHAREDGTRTVQCEVAELEIDSEFEVVDSLEELRDILFKARHKHTRTRTRTRTHTHPHTQTRTHTPTHTLTHSLTHTHTLTRTRACCVCAHTTCNLSDATCNAQHARPASPLLLPPTSATARICTGPRDRRSTAQLCAAQRALCSAQLSARMACRSCCHSRPHHAAAPPAHGPPRRTRAAPCRGRARSTRRCVCVAAVSWPSVEVAARCAVAPHCLPSGSPWTPAARRVPPRTRKEARDCRERTAAVICGTSLKCSGWYLVGMAGPLPWLWLKISLPRCGVRVGSIYHVVLSVRRTDGSDSAYQIGRLGLCEPDAVQVLASLAVRKTELR